jgi:hypothetical protein
MATGDKIVNLDDLKAVHDHDAALMAQVTAKNLAAGMTYNSGKTIRSDTGATRTSSWYRSSDYIDVSGCTKIIYPRLITTSGGNNLIYCGAAFYDSSKAFIADSGTPALLGAYNNWIATELTVPSGAVYFRATWVPADNGFNEAGEFWLYDAVALGGSMADTVIMLDEEGYATQQSIAPVDTEVAKATHTAGTLVVVNGILCKVTDGVAVGDNIFEHSTYTTVAAQLKALETRLAALEANS